MLFYLMIISPLERIADALNGFANIFFACRTFDGEGIC